MVALNCERTRIVITHEGCDAAACDFRKVWRHEINFMKPWNLFVLLVLAGCGAGGGTAAPAAPSAPALIAEPISCSPAISTDYSLADHYVDSSRGDDANPGSAAQPWKTIDRALQLQTQATVHVRDGVYTLSESSSKNRSGYLTLKAADGAKPQLTLFSLLYTNPGAANLRIVGFNILGQQSNGGPVVRVSNASDVEILNNSIKAKKYLLASAEPGKPYEFQGILIEKASRVLVRSNCVTSVFFGMQVRNSSEIFIERNVISPQAGSAIQYLGGNSATTIEDNHLLGSKYVPYPLDPDGMIDPHSSIISIRSGGLVVRNNVMHGMGTSSGLMSYLPDAAGNVTAYTDIDIEGNLIYDVHNVYPLRMYNAAERIRVRNNIIVGRYSQPSTSCPDGITPDARGRYDHAFVMHNIAAGYDGSGVLVANNILVGQTTIQPGVMEKNNIFWSVQDGGSGNFLSTSPTSKVIASAYGGCGTHSKYFDQGFFTEAIDYRPAHGKIFSFIPGNASDAINYGDAAVQLSKILGRLDANNLFLEPGGTRLASQHSAGPYEP